MKPPFVVIHRVRSRLVFLLAAVLLLGAGEACAQVTSVEVYRHVDAGAAASDAGVGAANDPFEFGPNTTVVLSGGGNTTFDVNMDKGGGHSEAHGLIQYLVSQSEITASGKFTEFTSVIDSASASAGIDATISLKFSVAEKASYRLWGWIQTPKALSNPELLACLRGGVVLAGDSRATPLESGVYMFDEDREIFPEDPVTIECGAACSAAQGESDNISWRFIIRFTDAGPTCGDPTGDGDTTAADALTALRAAVGQVECPTSVCDVNGSGTNTASDGLAILKLAVGLPFPWDCPSAV
jgi:hypothetical protein